MRSSFVFQIIGLDAEDVPVAAFSRESSKVLGFASDAYKATQEVNNSIFPATDNGDNVMNDSVPVDVDVDVDIYLHRDIDDSPYAIIDDRS